MKKTNLLPIGLILVGLLLGQTAHAFTFIQAATSTDNINNGGLCNVQFPNNTTAGDLITVGISSKIATSSVISVADGSNDTFALGAAASSVAANVNGEVWYALNIAGGTKSVTSTITAQSTGSGYNCIAAEFSGASAKDIAIATTSVTGASLTWTSGTSTTNFANELIVGAGGLTNNGGPMTQGTGYTKVSSSTNSRSIMEYATSTSATAWSAWATSGGSGRDANMEMVTFYSNSAPPSGEGAAVCSVYNMSVYGGTFL